MKGFIFLHRKIRSDWKWRKPAWLRAWVWLLIHAVWEPEGRDGLKRGQCKLSLGTAAGDWGMSRSHAKRFLNECESQGDIEWLRASGGRPKYAERETPNPGTVSGTVSGTGLSIVTILNYAKYQPGLEYNSTVSGTVSVQLSGNSPANNKKEHIAATVPVAASPGMRAMKARRTPGSDPRNKELLDVYSRLFREIRGYTYVVDEAKDAAAIKRLLGSLDPEDITSRMAQFLRDDEPWLQKQGHTIALFARQVDSYRPLSAGRLSRGNSSHTLPAGLEESLRQAYGDNRQEAWDRE